MSFIINQENTPTFGNGIRVGNVSVDATSSDTNYGTIRYNRSLDRFEGLHHSDGSGPSYTSSSTTNLNAYWRTFGTDRASSTLLGAIKVGTNLTINSTTGVL